MRYREAVSYGRKDDEPPAGVKCSERAGFDWVLRNVRAGCGNAGRRLVARALHAVQARAVMRAGRRASILARGAKSIYGRMLGWVSR